MDISDRFSFEDFLAYFFPGIIGTFGIYCLLMLTSFQEILLSLPLDVITGILFVVLSFIIGILLSGVAEIVVGKLKSHKSFLPFSKDINNAIVKAFKDLYGKSDLTRDTWSREHFYFCRSYVYERMPNVIPALQRQSGLRQLRISLIPVLVIWYFAGFGWGLEFIRTNSEHNGLALIIISTILFAIFLSITINRARSNESREVREVLSAFLAGNSSKKR